MINLLEEEKKIAKDDKLAQFFAYINLKNKCNINGIRIERIGQYLLDVNSQTAESTNNNETKEFTTKKMEIETKVWQSVKPVYFLKKKFLI